MLANLATAILLQYKRTKSIRCTPSTYTMVYVDYISIKQHKTKNKIKEELPGLSVCWESSQNKIILKVKPVLISGSEGEPEFLVFFLGKFKFQVIL